MHLNTRLDVDLVAVEQQDELTLLVELTAPTAPATTRRAPATLQVVLDRSGSMSGERLEGAKQALTALVQRLDPQDCLGVVAFDHSAQVVVPCGPLQDKSAVQQAIAAVDAGGSTDLSGGYLRGLQEASRQQSPAGATVLLVSDGHATDGVRDPERLRAVADKARQDGVTTSTLGFGLGYDERLLHALAQGGGGAELFAEEADTAVSLIGGVVDGLLEQVAQAASLRLRWTEHVESAQVLNDLPVTPLPDGLQVELGSFYAGETRRVVLTLRVPGIAALGLAQVASLDLLHVALPDLVQHSTTVPVHVNVVPGDQAAGRVADPVVRSEALFQQTQQAKRRSSRLLSEGRVAEAESLLGEAGSALRAAAVDLPVPLAEELSREARLLDDLVDEARIDLSRAAKVSSYSAMTSSRTRGRRTKGLGIVLASAVAQLHLEDWEVLRLRRALPVDLAPLLEAGASASAAEAARLAAAAPYEELARFLEDAAASGGFTVSRA